MAWKTNNGTPTGVRCGGRWSSPLVTCHLIVEVETDFFSRFGASDAVAATHRWNTVLQESGKQYVQFVVQNGIPNAPVGISMEDLGEPDPLTPNKWRVGTASLRWWLPAQDGWLALNAAAIRINSNPRGWGFCTTFDNPCPDSSRVPLEAALVHELGHALGLGHPATGPGSAMIMACVVDRTRGAFLHDDDRSGALYINSDHGADFGQEGPDPGC